MRGGGGGERKGEGEKGGANAIIVLVPGNDFKHLLLTPFININFHILF